MQDPFFKTSVELHKDIVTYPIGRSCSLHLMMKMRYVNHDRHLPAAISRRGVILLLVNSTRTTDLPVSLQHVAIIVA